MLTRLLVFPIVDGIQPSQPADPKQIKKLGDAPVTLQFRTDDKEVVEIAVPGEVLAQAQGPFFPHTTQ